MLVRKHDELVGHRSSLESALVMLKQTSQDAVDLQKTLATNQHRVQEEMERCATASGACLVDFRWVAC